MLRLILIILFSLPLSAFAEPQRIVSLAPSITEAIFAVGAGDRVAAVSRFCDYPPETEKLPKVGGLIDRNYEAILAVRPDLIIGIPESEDIKQKLEKLGAKVLYVRQETVQDILDGIRKIGDETGESKRAAELAADLESEVVGITKLLKDRPRPKVLVSAAGERISGKLVNTIIAGRKTYLGELIELAGAENAYQGSIPYPGISAEGLLALNPEIVIELLPEGRDNPVTPEMIVQAWGQLPQIKAVTARRIHVLQAEYTVNPGPRFVKTLKDIASVIHPDTMSK